LQNAVDIAEHIAVPNPDRPISKLAQHGIALAIGGAVRMLAAIDLDNEMQIATDEVCDVGSDRLLPYELETAELPVAQMPPKQHSARVLRRRSARARSVATVLGPRIVAPHPDPLPAGGERELSPD
jgi:hypothetical protein